VPSLTNTSEPVARVLSRVHEHLGTPAKPHGTGWRTRCPVHKGKSDSSLAIAQGNDGRVLLNCFSGCTHDAIVAALGIEKRELFADADDSAAPPPRAPRLFLTAREAAEGYRATLGQEAARWIYRDAAGNPVGMVMRWNLEDGSKTIRPLWRIGEKWQQTYPPQRSIYALDRLEADRAGRVFVTEGEKCAEMIATLGLLATTSPGGANGADRATWEPLAGREVVILPDSDEAGRKYAEAVRARLAALTPPPRVAIVTLPGLEDGEDAVEFVGRVHGGSIEAARQAIEGLAETALADAPRKRITLSDLLADPKLRRKPETIPSGWRPFDRSQPFEALERGAKVVLSAPPGCYKTATMLRMARGFAEQGHRVAWLAAEMQPRALARRMLCQAARLGQAALLSEAMPPDHARRFAEAEKQLAALEGCLEFTTAPIGFEELDRAAEGADVVFVDYLQLLRHPDASIRGHERIEDVMARIAEAAQRTGAAFVMAAAQGRDGGGDTREIHNATRGSSSIEFTVDALYCAKAPSNEERKSPGGFTIEFRCLKQREGTPFPIEVRIDGSTGAIAEVAP